MCSARQLPRHSYSSDFTICVKRFNLFTPVYISTPKSAAKSPGMYSGMPGKLFRLRSGYPDCRHECIFQARRLPVASIARSS